MKPLKRVFCMLLTLTLLLYAAGCGSSGSQESETPPPAGTTEEPESPPAEKPEPAKPVLLAVSFGTSYDSTRNSTIGAIESALRDAYPHYEVRRAFTSQIIIDILAERGLDIDNVTEAMDRLVSDGVKEVLVQPTHVMPGFEYDDIMAEVSDYADKFESFKTGLPILASDADYDALISALVEETAAYNTDGAAIVFMGHGTHHEANAAYATLQQKLTDAGHTNYFIGTVEGGPLVDEVLPLVRETGASRVVLLPLMIVAGDHANNDMAGDEADSWKTVFASAGFEVECVLNGLGQYEGVQQIIVEHAAAAK